MRGTRYLHSRGDSPRAVVLVAEDDRELRRLVSKVLANDGHDVVEVPDGTAFLDYLTASAGSRRAPDVIVSDIFMPGSSGLEVLARMRELGVDVPVVLMTAYANQLAKAGAADLGAVTVLEKPFELDDLRMIVLNLAPQRVSEAPSSARGLEGSV
jgi:CheY-like chemotaxis protein